MGASEINDLCYKLFFEAGAQGMLLASTEGALLDANPEACTILGYGREELLRGGLRSVLDTSDPRSKAVFEGRRLGETRELELRLLRRDGTSFLAVVSLAESACGDDKGSFGVVFRRRDGGRAAVGKRRDGFEEGPQLIEDVAQRRRAEEALRQREDLYRTVVEQAAENIFVVDFETKRILEANAALHASLGYTAEELRRLTIYEIVAHDRESVDLSIERISKNGRLFLGERQFRRKDGCVVDVEVNVSPILYGGREAMCVVAHDVTERKKAEEGLRRSLEVLLALREAGQILGSTLESEEVVSRLLGIMRRVSNLTATVISVRDGDGRVRVWRSGGLERLWPRARYAPEAEAARRAALENGGQRLFRLRHPDSEAEDLTGLCLPFLARNRLAGVLEAYGSEDLADGEMIEIIGSLTSQAASALENALLYQDLAEREQRLHDLVGQLLRVQEEERRRVAYEVHDGLAQVASAAHQRLQTYARRHLPESHKGEQDLRRIVQLVHQTVGEARRIIGNLRPTALDDFGLAAAVSQAVDQLRGEGWSVYYEPKLGNIRLPAAIETAVFRASQEALTNVRKHARTGEVCVELSRDNGGVRLRVRDRGQGFDPDRLNTTGPGERVGIAGMRERIALLGGRFELWSYPGEGTLVSVDVPLPATEGDYRRGR